MSVSIEEEEEEEEEKWDPGNFKRNLHKLTGQLRDCNLFNDIEQMDDGEIYKKKKKKKNWGSIDVERVTGSQSYLATRSSLSSIVDKYKHKIETFINIER